MPENRSEATPDVVANAVANFVAAVVQPGDVLVVALNRRISMQELSEFEEHFGKYAPGVRVVVIPEAVDMAVYKPHEQHNIPPLLEGKDSDERA